MTPGVNGTTAPDRFRGRRRVRSLVLTFALLLGLALPSGAAGYVYFDQDTNVGRANLDGTGVDHSFITGGNAVCGEAANSSFLYWANSGNTVTGPIGRANLDGAGINQNFIGGADFPCGIAVDGSHVYWTNDLHNDPGTIGRVGLDGTTGLTQTFITGAHGPFGIAVDGAHVYWGNNATNAIGRAGLDGTTGLTQTFITGAHSPSGVAVDGAHVYWTNEANGTIGRVGLDGTTGLNQSFIPNAGSSPCGIAVDSGHIYWAHAVNPGRISRASLNGTNVEQNFITGAGNGPCGVAVDSLGPSGTPSNSFTIVPRVTCAGVCHVILVKITFDSAGNVTAEQALAGQLSARESRKPKALIKPLSRAVSAGKNNLKLKLTRRGRKTLNAKGKLTIRVRFRFTPTGGTARTKVRALTVKLPTHGH